MALKKYGNNKFLIPLRNHWERILCLAYSSIDNSLSPILVFVNTMLWKFDTSKRNENDKNTNFMTKNNSKNSKKYVVIWSIIIFSGSELALLTYDVICSKVLRKEGRITHQKLSMEHIRRASYVNRFFYFLHINFFDESIFIHICSLNIRDNSS